MGIKERVLIRTASDNNKDKQARIRIKTSVTIIYDVFVCYLYAALKIELQLPNDGILNGPSSSLLPPSSFCNVFFLSSFTCVAT